jgi:hypothetical protein
MKKSRKIIVFSAFEVAQGEWAAKVDQKRVILANGGSHQAKVVVSSRELIRFGGEGGRVRKEEARAASSIQNAAKFVSGRRIG